MLLRRATPALLVAGVRRGTGGREGMSRTGRPAGPSTWSMRSISAGFNAVDLNIDLALGCDGYRLDLSSKVEGLMRYILPWSLRVRSDGAGAGRRAGAGTGPYREQLARQAALDHARIPRWPSGDRERPAQAQAARPAAREDAGRHRHRDRGAERRARHNAARLLLDQAAGVRRPQALRRRLRGAGRGRAAALQAFRLFRQGPRSATSASRICSDAARRPTMAGWRAAKGR